MHAEELGRQVVAILAVAQGQGLRGFVQLDGGRDTHRIGLAEGRSTRIPRFGTARPAATVLAVAAAVIKDVAGQVLVLGQLAEVAVDVAGIDQDRLVAMLAGQVGGAERDLFQQPLEQRMQAAGTDVLGLSR